MANIQRTCAHPYCTKRIRPENQSGYCRPHGATPKVKCGYEPCNLLTHGKSVYCKAHYQQDRTSGILKPIQPWSRHLSDTDRFWEKVEKGDGCWNWKAAVTKDGYGFFNNKGKPKLAHRHSYEMSNGLIGQGADLDHKCRNRRCVNPAHLREATRKQNMENHGGAQSNSKTKIRGVSWHKGNNQWKAAIQHNGSVHVRYFKDLEAA